MGPTERQAALQPSGQDVTVAAAALGHAQPAGELQDALPFQIVKFLPSNSTAPRVDCAFLVSVHP